MVSAKMIASAAVLLAATTVSALGSAVVQNSCAFDVYLWSVSNVAGSMVTLAAGGEYSETYKTNPDGGGISIKLATETAGSNVTQFEYTLETTELWYDVSNINGYPFVEYGLTLVPSVSTCRSIVCPAGTALCADAYNTPDENYATAECVSTASTVLVLCSGDDTTSPGSSASSVASVAVAGTTVAPSTAAATTFSSTSFSSNSTSYSSTTVHTTFVTAVVTVEATAATTTAAAAEETFYGRFGPAKERRAGHIHRHAHAHGHQA